MDKINIGDFYLHGLGGESDYANSLTSFNRNINYSGSERQLIYTKNKYLNIAPHIKCPYERISLDRLFNIIRLGSLFSLAEIWEICEEEKKKGIELAHVWPNWSNGVDPHSISLTECSNVTGDHSYYDYIYLSLSLLIEKANYGSYYTDKRYMKGETRVCSPINIEHIKGILLPLTSYLNPKRQHKIDIFKDENMNGEPWGPIKSWDEYLPARLTELKYLYELLEGTGIPIIETESGIVLDSEDIAVQVTEEYIRRLTP